MKNTIQIIDSDCSKCPFIFYTHRYTEEVTKCKYYGGETKEVKEGNLCKMRSIVIREQDYVEVPKPTPRGRVTCPL